MAFVLAPEPPLATWVESLRVQVEGSAGVLTGRPVIVDLGCLPADEPGLDTLAHDLQSLGLRPVEVEGGVLPGAEHLSGSPLTSGRDTVIEAAEPQPAISVAVDPAPDARPRGSLIVDQSVRSGQSVQCPTGDVTVLGSVASGAEVLAGGSIHVYGSLRGRAIAGALGDTSARIFCGRMDAELVSIDGLYRTAETIDAALRGKPVQVRMEGETLVVALLR